MSANIQLFGLESTINPGNQCNCGLLLYPGAVTLEMISPQVIVLSPPEKLVIETRASGSYQRLEWSRNGTLLTGDFVNFYETFVHEPTTTDDLGVYEVRILPTAGQTQTLDVQFFVTRYSKDHT